MLCCAVFVPAQQPQTSSDDIVRIDTSLVQLQVVVTDKNGNFIERLNRDDFEVIEDGIPQRIGFVSFGHIPLRNRDSIAVGTLQSLPEGSIGERNAKASRAIALVVDTFHMSGSDLDRTKSELKRFVAETLSDNDVAIIVTPNGIPGTLQFTNQKPILTHALDKVSLFPRNRAGRESLFTPYLAFKISNNDPSALDIGKAILAAEGEQADDEHVRFRAEQILLEEANLSKNLLTTLRAIADLLGQVRAQRIMLLFSEGFSTLDGSRDRSREMAKVVAGNASRLGVVICSVNVGGLKTSEFHRANFPRIDLQNAITMQSNFERFDSEAQTEGATVLRDLAAETGGDAYINTNDIKRAVTQALEKNSAFYSIGYYPDTNKNNKDFRNVAVHIKGHPDYRVRTEKGYTPYKVDGTLTEGTPKQRLIRAMNAPLPKTMLRLSISADFLERADDDATVTVQAHIDGSSFEYLQQGNNYALGAEILMAVYDMSGKLIVAPDDLVKSALTSKQVEQAKQEGFRITKRLTLKPGFYKVLAGVRDTNSDLFGTATSWVEVPDSGKNHLVISGIFLARARSVSTEVADANLEAHWKLVIGRATFQSGDTALYRFVVYGLPSKRENKSNIELKVELTNNGTSIYDGGWQPLASRFIREDSKGVEAGGQLKVNLPPGIYDLHVMVRDKSANKLTERTVPVEVN